MHRTLVCVTVFATTLIGILGSTTLAQSKVPGPNGQIVFTRHGRNFDNTFTYVANPDGSHIRPLLPGYTSDSPHWSPDGTEVAVNSGLDAPCPPTCTGNTVIINPDTGSYRVLPSRGYPTVSTFCSIWSPDASHFLCDGENDSDPRVNGIYTIRSSDGGGLTRITNARGGDDIPIDYSPNGRQIVFGHTGPFHTCDKRSALYVVNVDGSGLHRITPWRFCDDDGSWSPDGSRIAFALDRGSVFSVHPDGTGLERVPLHTRALSFAGDVSWAPNGRKMVFILFVRTAPGTFQEGIGTAKTDGSDVKLVTTSPTKDTQPDWGPHPLIP
jgi:Tol biopolymer transport system component